MSPVSHEEHLQEVGARIRRERLRRGWRQADLAERVGTSRQRIVRIENGTLERVPHVELRTLARVLGVGLGYLVVAEDHPVHCLLREPEPRFAHHHLVSLAAVGIASRLLHAGPADPAALEDMAHALLHCREEPLSRAVIEGWLKNGADGDAS